MFTIVATVERRVAKIQRRMLLCFIAALTALLGVVACSASKLPAADAPEQPPPPQTALAVQPPVESDHSASPIALTSEDPSWGNSDALVTVVGFMDFECPFCARVQPTLKLIRETYGPERVRFVWKHNPLAFHKAARPAHEASVAVFNLGGSDAFFDFQDAAFAEQTALTGENFASWAAASGVDREAFEAELQSPEVAAKVDADMAQARELGATGTPAFRINGRVLSGAQPFDRFAEVINVELVEAHRLIAQGTPRAKVSLELTRKNHVPVPPADEAPARADNPPPEPDLTVYRVPVDPADPVEGPNDALVTIVQFSDFQCPFCKRVLDTLDTIRKEYPKDVRTVWKDNPLPFHTQAKPAAEFARYVKKHRGQDAFWKVHDVLFERQTELGEALFEEIAKQHNLAWPLAKAAIERGDFSAEIEEQQELAAGLEARGTPSFFINGRKLAGAQPYERFRELIEEQLAVAKALVEGGVSRRRVYEKIMESATPPAEPERLTAPAVTAAQPSRGPLNAPVVIQAFIDFQCPFCQRVQPTLEKLVKQYPKEVRIVYRHLPLGFHEHARLAAEASMEAFAQKGNAGFLAYHDRLFEHQTALSRADLERYALELGLDVTRFRAALDQSTHARQIEADQKLAADLGITGTPSFLINDYLLVGAQAESQFRRRIKLALAKKKGRAGGGGP